MSEPMLKQEYQRVNVLVTTPHFTTVPVAAFQKEDVDAVYGLTFPKDTSQHVSYNVLRRSGIAIVFGFDKNIHQLLLDDFPRARFYASASTLIEFFSEKSLIGQGKKMYVYLHEKEMTLYAFEQGGRRRAVCQHVPRGERGRYAVLHPECVEGIGVRPS